MKRAGEKDRKSSCLFAELIARCAIEKFEELKKKNIPKKALVGEENGSSTSRTVIAAFVVFDELKNEARCLSVASGTKTVDDLMFDSEMMKVSSERFVIRDSHAEVLARRALKRTLALEILALQSSTIDASTLEEGEGGDDANDFFLEKVDDESSESRQQKFRKRERMSLHLYVSSCPCGNATIRKWAKGGQSEARYETLGEFEIPKQKHDTFLPLDVCKGSVAISMKKATTTAAATTTTTTATTTKSDDDTAEDEDENEKLVAKGMLAKGTLIVGENKIGRMVTCSDKIAIWNVVGVQGGLLSTQLLEPIFIDSVTIGRKFAFKHCSRAFCCRISSMKSFKDDVNHPVLMQCERKFDLIPIETASIVFDNPNSLIYNYKEKDDVEVVNGKNGKSVSSSSFGSPTRTFSASRYCSSSFENLFFDKLLLVKKETTRAEEDDDDADMMKQKLREYNKTKSELFLAFTPRIGEQTRVRRASIAKKYYHFL